MNTSKLVSLLIISFLIFSCKSTKKVIEEHEMSTSYVQSIDTSSLDSLLHSFNQTIRYEAEDVEIEWEETLWSLPDSTGKQYPIKTKKGKTDSKKEVKEESIDSTKVQVTKTDYHTNDSVYANEKDTTTTKQVTKDNIPWWSIILVAAIVFLIYSFIRYITNK